MPRTILVIEDDEAIRQGLVDALQFHGYATQFAGRGDDGLKLAMTVEADLMLLDLRKRGLTGKVAEPILGREAKLKTLFDLREAFDFDNLDTLVIGDGANDLAMIQKAGLGVAYHAKPAVAEAAASRIDHGDLTALLYAQGYKRSEFVTA